MSLFLPNIPQLPAIEPVGTPDHSAPAPAPSFISSPPNPPWTALFAATVGTSDNNAHLDCPGSEPHLRTYSTSNRKHTNSILSTISPSPYADRETSDVLADGPMPEV